MKYSFGVTQLSIALLALIALLSVNNVQAAIDGYLKVGDINGESEASDKANDRAGETSSDKEQTRFAQERIGEIADKLGR
jgi:hypothetical protein